MFVAQLNLDSINKTLFPTSNSNVHTTLEERTSLAKNY